MQKFQEYLHIRDYFVDLQCYDELELKITLFGMPRKSVLSRICDKCDDLYYVYTEKDGFVWFDKHFKHIPAPKKVKCSFHIYGDNIKTLKGSPSKVYGNLIVNSKALLNLIGGPEEVKYCIYLNGCENLVSLDGAPRKLGGQINTSFCKNISETMIADYYA